MDDDVLPPHPPRTAGTVVDDPHAVPTPALSNLRDIGGRATADGARVRRGVAYRSAELRSPAVADDPTVASLGLRTVVDLRTFAEHAVAPDVLPAGAQGVHLDVLALDPHAPAADLTQVLADPRLAEQVLADLDPAGQMVRTYVDLVAGAPARRGYATLLRRLLDPADRPLLYHCTAGKDRTGWATTVLLVVAGVDEDGVHEEYLAVNPTVRAMYAPLLDGFAAVGGDPELLVPLLEVREAYLEAALDATEEHYGGFDGYLRRGLGLHDAELAEIRAVLRDEG